MNKTMILVLILLFSVTLFSTEIKNTDKPLKGTWDFSPQKVWETQTAGDDLLVDVRQIRVDDGGNIYLMEGKHSKLYVFDTDGKFRFAFGKKGSGPGEYRFAFTSFL
ncbi:MAG: 6-bladed beta-propeller [bacterium]|nr:6-bladed beta-propeller [bacterium]